MDAARENHNDTEEEEEEDLVQCYRQLLEFQPLQIPRTVLQLQIRCLGELLSTVISRTYDSFAIDLAEELKDRMVTQLQLQWNERLTFDLTFHSGNAQTT